MAHGLTQRQRDILAFIAKCIRDEGMPPTIAEIGAAFGIASTNGVNDHLRALERKGYISRTNKARGIHLTDKAAGGLFPTDVRFAPLVGRIAAGKPIFAEENIEDYIPVHGKVRQGSLFALRVQGDSMVEAGILEGDVILVDPNLSPQPGDIVVALVEGEATVKQYYPRDGQIELRPANAQLSSLVVKPESVLIQGVVVGLQRYFTR